LSEPFIQSIMAMNLADVRPLPHSSNFDWTSRLWILWDQRYVGGPTSRLVFMDPKWRA